MTRLGPLLAAAGAAVLALTACGPGDDPGPNYSSVSPTASASTSASPSPTGSPSPTVPTTGPNVSPGGTAPSLPANATGQTQDAALEYAGYFWKMLDWAYATNNSDFLEPLFAATCKSCQKFRTSIATDVNAGYSLIGGRIQINSVRAADLSGGVVPAQYAFDVSLQVDQLVEKGRDGAVATSYPASTTIQRTYVSWISDRWQVVNTAQVSA